MNYDRVLRAERNREIDRATWSEWNRLEYQQVVYGPGEWLTPEPVMFGRAFESPPYFTFSAAKRGEVVPGGVAGFVKRYRWLAFLSEPTWDRTILPVVSEVNPRTGTKHLRMVWSTGPPNSKDWFDISYAAASETGTLSTVLCSPGNVIEGFVWVSPQAQAHIHASLEFRATFYDNEDTKISTLSSPLLYPNPGSGYVRFSHSFVAPTFSASALIQLRVRRLNTASQGKRNLDMDDFDVHVNGVSRIPVGFEELVTGRKLVDQVEWGVFPRFTPRSSSTPTWVEYPADSLLDGSQIVTIGVAEWVQDERDMYIGAYLWYKVQCYVFDRPDSCY